MTRETAEKILPIIKAYAEGRDIEYNDFDDHWIILNGDPNFNSDPKNYRIKSEPKLVPFTFEDNLMFRDKWIKLKDKITLYRIISVVRDSVIILSLNYSYFELLNDFEFEDGSPCGKYVNE